MPTFAIESPQTGQKYQVQFDREPSLEDLDFAAKQFDNEWWQQQGIEPGSAITQQTPLETVGNAIANVGPTLSGMVGGGMRYLDKAAQVLADVTGGQRGGLFEDIAKQAEGIQAEGDVLRPLSPANPTAQNIGQGAAQGIGMLATMGASMPVMGARGLVAVPAALGFGAGAGQGVQQGEAMGLSPVGQLAQGTAFGVAEAATEALGGIGGRFLRPARSVLGRMAGGVASETIEEPAAGALQEAITNVSGLVVADPKRPGFTTTGFQLPGPAGYLNRRTQEAIGGAAGGLVFAGVQPLIRGTTPNASTVNPTVPTTANDPLAQESIGDFTADEARALTPRQPILTNVPDAVPANTPVSTPPSADQTVPNAVPTPPQTLTGPDVQTGTVMPVPPPTAAAGAGAGVQVVSSGKPDGAAVETTVEFVEAADLAPLLQREVNADQTRDRANNRGSAEQIARIAVAPDPQLLGNSPVSSIGAPVVDDVVLAGNGRAEGLLKGYTDNTPGMQRYRASIELQAAQMGRDISTMQQPVMIRRVQRYVSGDRRSFVRESNPKYAALQETTAEAALLDAEALGDLSRLEFTENGTLTSAATQQVAMKLKEAQRGVNATTGGRPDVVEATRRVQLAALATLARQNNVEVSDLSAFLETDTGRRVLVEFTRAAPGLAALDADLGLGDVLLPALTVFNQGALAVQQRKFANINEWATNRNRELIRENVPVESEALIEVMVAATRKPSILRSLFELYLEAANNEQQQRQLSQGSADIFGEARANQAGRNLLTRVMAEQSNATAETSQGSDGQTAGEVTGTGFTNLNTSGRTAGFLNTEILAEGAALIQRGITDFTNWSRAMVQRFGAAIREFLAGIWQQITSPQTNAAQNVRLGMPQGTAPVSLGAGGFLGIGQQNTASVSQGGVNPRLDLNAVLPAVESTDSFQSASERPTTLQYYNEYAPAQAKRLFQARRRLAEAQNRFTTAETNERFDRENWEMANGKSLDIWQTPPVQGLWTDTFGNPITAEEAQKSTVFEGAADSRTVTVRRRNSAYIFGADQILINGTPVFTRSINPRTGEAFSFAPFPSSANLEQARQELVNAEVEVYLAEEADDGQTDRLAAKETAAEWARRQMAAEFAALLDARDKDARNAASTFLAQVWLAFGRHDENFQYGRISSTSAADIAQAVSTAKSKVTASEARTSITFKTRKGSLTIHNANTRRPYIRSTEAASQGTKSGGGSQLYQAALDWIHNNGKQIKDDVSLTDINAVRRTSNFLSSAIRWGTTRHLKPHAKQGVKFSTTSDTRNIAALATREMEHAFMAVAQAREWQYDFNRNEFVDTTGNPVSKSQFKDAINAGNPAKSGVGLSTLQRAIITNSAIQSFQRGDTEGALSPASIGRGARSGLKGILYVDPFGLMVAADALTRLAKTASSLASFSQKALNQFGRWVEPHLKAIWRAAKTSAETVRQYLKEAWQAANSPQTNAAQNVRLGMPQGTAPVTVGQGGFVGTGTAAAQPGEANLTQARFAPPNEAEQVIDRRADADVLTEAQTWLAGRTTTAAVNALEAGAAGLPGDTKQRAMGLLINQLSQTVTQGEEAQQILARTLLERMSRVWIKEQNSADVARELRQRGVVNNADLVPVSPILAALQLLVDRGKRLLKARFPDGEEGVTKKIQQILLQTQGDITERVEAILNTVMGAMLSPRVTLQQAVAGLLGGKTQREQIIDDVARALMQRAKQRQVTPERQTALAALVASLKRTLGAAVQGKPNAPASMSFGELLARTFVDQVAEAPLFQEAWNAGREQVRGMLIELGMTEAEAAKRLNELMPATPAVAYAPGMVKQAILRGMQAAGYGADRATSTGQREVDMRAEVLQNPQRAMEAVMKVWDEEAAAAGLSPEAWSRGRALAQQALTETLQQWQEQRQDQEAKAQQAAKQKIMAKDSPVLVKLLNDLRNKIAPGMTWTEIFTDMPDSQKDRQREIYQRLLLDERLKDLTLEERVALTNELDKAWQRERRTVFQRELQKAGVLGEKKASDRQKVLNGLPKLLRLMNLGVLTADTVREALMGEFGLRSLTAADVKRLRSMAEAAYALPEGSLRDRALQEMLKEMQAKTGSSRMEILSNYWTASVLSGLRTQFDTFLSVINGMGTNLMQAATLMARGRGAAAVQAHAQWWRFLIDGVRESGQILLRGDQSYLKKFGQSLQDALKGERTGAVPVGEMLWRNGNVWQKYFMAPVMLFSGRLMAAADHMNNTATTGGALAVARALNPELYQGRVAFTAAERAAAREQAITEVTGGDSPTTAEERAQVSVRTREILSGTMQPEDVQAASEIGDMAAFQNDPTGLFGTIYHAMKGALGFATRKLGEVAEDETASRFARMVSAALGGSLHGLTGTRFMRFGFNFGADLTRYMPGTYLLGKAGFYGRNVSRMQQELLLGKNLVGLMVGSTLAAMFLSKDDEEEGWHLEGDWSTLTPQQQKQRMTAGLERMTMWKREDGQVRRVSYKQWPTMSLFSMVGRMLDEKRHKPEIWAQRGVAGHLLAASLTGVFQIQNVSAMQNLVQIFGQPTFAGDPASEWAERMIKMPINYAGGLVPTLVKDADIWSDPRSYKPEGAAELLMRNMPVARRFVNDGRAQLNMLGEEVKLQRAPWSRAYTSVESGNAHRVLGALMARGLTLPAASDEAMVTVNGVRAPIEALGREAVWRYEKAVGEGYRAWLASPDGQTLLTMPLQQAERVIDYRSKAIKRQAKVRLGY